MDSKVFVKNYWNYYLELEKQVLGTRRYVDFNSQNNATYSVEYLQLLLAIGSEIDVVAKAIVSERFANSNEDTINQWGAKLESILSDMPNISVVFNDDYDVNPWKNWFHEFYKDKNNKDRSRLKKNSKNPKWWQEYNKVKHQRTASISKDNKRTYYSRACLQNVVLALAALWIIESEYIELISSKESTPYLHQQSFLYKKA